LTYFKSYFDLFDVFYLLKGTNINIIKRMVLRRINSKEGLRLRLYFLIQLNLVICYLLTQD
jgi:hypothetical protein